MFAEFIVFTIIQYLTIVIVVNNRCGVTFVKNIWFTTIKVLYLWKITDMKEKLEYLLRSGGYTATSLARLLEIQPSGLSHILSGRNKPSFDLVVKILRAFPDVNPDWLLLDSDQIFRTAATTSPFDKPKSDEGEKSTDALFSSPENNQFSTSSEKLKNDEVDIFQSLPNAGKRVEKIVVLYSDKTFDSYTAK